MDWSPEDSDLSWVNLFYVLTDEDRRTGWSVGDELEEIFLEFLGASTSPTSQIYAILTPSDHEYGRMLKDLETAGLPFVEEKPLSRNRRLLRKLLRIRGEGYIYVAGVDWRKALQWYRSYIG